jgi:RNA polymerase-binding protein DksA
MSLDTDRIRADLESRRARLVGVVERRDNPDSLEDESGEVVASVDNHLADTATDTYDRELEDGIEEDAERLIERIDDALGRIDAGTYGTCEVCGREIGEERLEAVPYATLCIDDARRLAQG